MVGTSKAARAAALNDAYISPFEQLDLANATHSASMAPLVFAANDNRDGEAAVASWSLSCGCGCGKGWTSFFRDGVGDRVRVPGVDTVTNPLLLDTVGGDSAGTAQAITVGSTTYGVIEDFNDQDFFSVTLVAGKTYAISQLLHVGGTATGDGTLLSGVPLADAYIELYGADGTTLLAEADGGSNTTPSGLDAKLFFTATETGTYFINARSFDQDPTNGTDGDHVGDYKLTVQEVAASEAPLPRFYSTAGLAPNALLDSLDWGSTWDHTVRNPDGDNGTRTDNGVANGGTPITNTEYGIVGKNVMKVYFAKQGDVFLSDDPLNPGLETSLQARNLEQWELDAFRATMDLYEQVTDLQYVEVDNRADADIKIIVYQGTPGAGASLLGRMSPPGEQNEGQMEINGGDYRWTEEGVSPGGFFFPTLLHEFGHGHGMKHPHDTGGGGPVMRGAEPSEDPVEGAIGGQYGDFGLSQQMYTIMSYNDGWNDTGGVGGRPAGHGGPSSGGLEMQADHYGWMGTLAALDIALLQDKYGVNEEWATGDDVYTIEDTNGAGHYYRTIWDGGGNDEIRYVGSRDATIDLRAATLQYEEGGGGRVSFAMGAWTGFTIANGVVIERATGGDGDDILTGNAAANTLDGGEGNDAIAAGLGNDTVYAGTGNDVISGDGGSDVLHGDDGDDAFLFAVGEPGGSTQAFGGAGTDTIILRGGGASIDLTTNGGSAGGVAISVNSIENIQFDGSADAGGGNRLAYGSDGNNAIVALGILAGVTFEGRGGDDLLIGGGGADSLLGGDGDDNINGADGNDTIDGGAGADHLLGGLGADWIYGGVGHDVISGDGGSDILFGGDGDDAFLFAVGEPGGATQAYGGTGTDTIILRGGGASIDLTTNGGSAGAVAISVNAIENVQFDGSVDAGGGNRLAYGSAGANSIVALGILAGVTFEGRGGDDLLVGGEGADSLLGGDDNDIIKGNGGDDAIDGGAGTDLVELRGLAADYTITAVAGGYRVADAVGGRDGSDLLTGVETLRFSDGSTVSLPVPVPGAPQVLPALAGDKTATGPEILPGASDDKALHDGPQILPGVDDGFSMPGRDSRTAADVAPRDGDTAQTLSDDLLVHDGYLFAATKDDGWPEVLPAMDDGFVLTGKFDDIPPVMPTATDLFDFGAPSITEMEMARELLMSLAHENPLNTSGDSLTLADDWSGLAQHRDAVWA